MTMTHVQADVLVSNKVNIPKCKSWSVFTTYNRYLSISLKEPVWKKITLWGSQEITRLNPSSKNTIHAQISLWPFSRLRIKTIDKKVITRMQNYTLFISNFFTRLFEISRTWIQACSSQFAFHQNSKSY